MTAYAACLRLNCALRDPTRTAPMQEAHVVVISLAVWETLSTPRSVAARMAPVDAVCPTSADPLLVVAPTIFWARHSEYAVCRRLTNVGRNAERRGRIQMAGVKEAAWTLPGPAVDAVAATLYAPIAPRVHARSAEANVVHGKSAILTPDSPTIPTAAEML